MTCPLCPLCDGPSTWLAFLRGPNRRVADKRRPRHPLRRTRPLFWPALQAGDVLGESYQAPPPSPPQAVIDRLGISP